MKTRTKGITEREVYLTIWVLGDVLKNHPDAFTKLVGNSQSFSQ